MRDYFDAIEEFIFSTGIAEEWRDTEFPVYEISNYGRCRNKKTGRMMKARPTKASGQKRIGSKIYLTWEYRLRHEGRTYVRKAHRLVALAFIPNPENKPQTNHKNYDSLNPYVGELEWMTAKENTADYWRHRRANPHLYEKKETANATI